MVRRLFVSLVLLTAVAVAAWSCSDVSPAGLDVSTPHVIADRHTPHSPADDNDDGDGTDADSTDENESEDSDSLVTCRPLPYDSVTQTVGPDGGEIEVGRNWLLIPRGALRQAVTITAVAPSDTVAVIRFQPSGLRFQATALLVATYDNCRVPKIVTPRLALVNDLFGIIEFLARGDSLLPRNFAKGHKGGHRRVVGQLHHFSNYAVAW